MLFGDPKQFAVEVHHEPEGPRRKGFGRMRIHIQGATIGNVREAHCSLFHAVERVCEVAEQFPRLWHENFSGHTEEEIFAWLDAILYGGEIESNDSELHRFDFLTNTGEQFDDAKSFIYCTPPGRVHVIYEMRDRVVRSASCEREYFQSAAASLARWFKEQIGNE